MLRAPTIVLGLLVAMLASALPGRATGPILVSPGGLTDFAPVHTACPTFSWGPAEGADTYEIVVWAVAEAGTLANSADLKTAPVLRQSIPGGALSWTPSAESCLEMFGRYAWAVRAVDEADTEAWSESRMFHVDPDPLLRRIGGVLDVALKRYLERRGIEAGTPGELAALIAAEMAEAQAVDPPVVAPPSERTVFFMGKETPVSEMEGYFEQRRLEGIADPLITSGGPGGTSMAIFTDEAEVVIDDEYDTAATKGILIFKSENSFDWGWGVNSSESGPVAAGTLFLAGAEATGDFIGFSPATGGANFNNVFVLNDFQLDPDDSVAGCTTAADEGKLRWDDSLSQLCGCDGVSWKRVRDGTAC